MLKTTPTFKKDYSMSRPVKVNETPSVFSTAPIKSANGTDVLIMAADYSVWNDTQGKFIRTEDAVRK